MYCADMLWFVWVVLPLLAFQYVCLTDIDTDKKVGDANDC